MNVLVSACLLGENCKYSGGNNLCPRLLDWLAETYDLEREQIIRHYDVTGKLCPQYYVKHEDKWEHLLDRITFAHPE